MPSVADEQLVRRNFTFDATGAVGTGLVNALIVNFLAVIARREGADPLLLAALAAGPFAANTLAIFSGFWVPGDRHRVKCAAGLLIGGRALFFIGILTSGPLSLLWMGFGMWLSMAVASPMQVDVWRGAYPQRMRARVLGYLRVLQSSATAIGAPLGGLLLDRIGQGPMLGIGAALGVLGAAGASRVRTAPVPASQRFTPIGSLRLLGEEPRYRRLIIAWVVWGFGSFMATPLYALVLVDRFQASYADVGVLQLVGAIAGLLAYFVLGQYLDRKGGFGATAIGLFLVGLVPIVYLLAPSLVWLGLGYILLNVGNSASDLGWQVALISRVSDEHRLRYQAAHTSLTGLRGVAAPFFGSLVLGLGFGVGPVLLTSAVLGMAGAAMMARALGISLSPTAVGTVFGNARRPRRDIGFGHRVVRTAPRVAESPALNVNEVLLARQQRSPADTIAGRRSAERSAQPARELVHNPAWYPLPLARVDVAEQGEVSEQHAPVAAESV
jgi:MFS family permease